MVDKLNKIENLESNSKRRNYNERKSAKKAEVGKRPKILQVIGGPREITIKCSCDDPMYINDQAVPCSCTYYKNHTLEASKGAGVIKYIKYHISYNCSK